MSVRSLLETRILHSRPFGPAGPLLAATPLVFGRLYSLPVQVSEHRLGAYAPYVEPAELERIRRLAAKLRGLRVLHLSAGPFGSNVADVLASLLPLQRDLGIMADWRVLRCPGDDRWDGLYERLSGGTVERLSSTIEAAPSSLDLQQLTSSFDVVVAHDPQVIGLDAGARNAKQQPRWLWHCHIDLRSAQPDLWASIRRGLGRFSAVLTPHPHFLGPEIPLPRINSTPSLDPCSPRNLPLSQDSVRAIVARLGLDPHRPTIGQFSPIGHRYASLATLGTYWLARRRIPDLQLVLADYSASSDEGLDEEAREVVEASSRDPDVHVFTRSSALTMMDLNALERHCAVILQAAVPRGFSRGVLEGHWKGKPAIVGQFGQLPDQVRRGRGCVVDGAPAAADALVELLSSPKLAVDMGRRAQQHIQRQHLVTRLAADYLRILRLLTHIDATIEQGEDPWSSP
ncbi:MAG: hypothetical protein KGJ86_01625 [Chloroflexota bacterium]|nr:hypothetical protein [Chloroflexota bacterium]